MWWYWCNLLNNLYSRILEFFSCKYLVLKVNFILTFVALLVEISNSCVSVLAIKNVYLLSSVVLFLIMLKAVYLLYQYVSYILVSLIKVLHRECNGIFGINIFFITNCDLRMVFIGSAACELVSKLTIITPKSVIQLESCIN